MYLGAREVELLGDHGNGHRRHKPQLRLDGMQHFEQWTGACLVFRNDAPHDGHVGGR